MAVPDAYDDSKLGRTKVADDDSNKNESASRGLDARDADRTRSKFKPVAATIEDDESESSSESDSSSSEGTSSDESGSDEDDIEADPQPDLRTRLAAFLPKISEANEMLSESARIDEVGDQEERYIEMNLGLGVLEKQDPDQVLTRTASNNVESETDDSCKDLTLEVAIEQPPAKRRKIEEVG